MFRRVLVPRVDRGGYRGETRYIQKSVSLNDDNRESVSQSVLREYNIPDMTLEEILEDRTGFESFMKHLVQEFR